MRRTLLLVAILGLIGIGCVPPTPPLAFTVRNTGATADSWFLHGDGFVAFLQREDAGGEGADLNGDGDQTDFVPALWSSATGAVTSTGLAVAGAPSGRPDGFRIVDSDVVAVGVSEAAQGGVDLNGDGDAVDSVLHIWKRSTTTPTNLGVALRVDEKMWASDGAVMATISEANQGSTDLNGDGDTNDSVQHAWTAANGLVSLGLQSNWGSVVAGSSGRFLIDVVPDPAKNAIEFQAVYDAFADTLVLSDLELIPGFDEAQAASAGNFALAGTESGYSPSTNDRDLNGDGDKTDTVLHIWRSDGTRTNIGVAVHWGSIWGLGDGGFLVGVPEANQAGTDLNGDGDTADLVAHIWTAAGALVNLGVSLDGFAQSRDLLGGGGTAAFGVWESEQGGTDLNGDGDTADRVTHIWSPGGGLLNTGLAQSYNPVTGPGGIGFGVSEAAQGGVDLNGDGDTSDSIAHLWSESKGVVGLGLAGVTGAYGPLPAPAGSFVAVAISEPANGGTDLNGNGSASDALVYAWDPLLGDAALVLPPGVAAPAIPQYGVTRWAASSRISVLVPESTAGPGATAVDLNGDGDKLDRVVHIVEATR